MMDPYISIERALIALDGLPEAAEAAAILGYALSQRKPPPKENIGQYTVPYWLHVVDNGEVKP